MNIIIKLNKSLAIFDHGLLSCVKVFKGLVSYDGRVPVIG